jgi:hypothetical protein
MTLFWKTTLSYDICCTCKLPLELCDCEEEVDTTLDEMMDEFIGGLMDEDFEDDFIDEIEDWEGEDYDE